MKLIWCPKCWDVVKLHYPDRQCECGESGGRYNQDGDTATIWGKAVVIGLLNTFFRRELTLKQVREIKERAGYDGDSSDVFWYPEDNGKISRKEKSKPMTSTTRRAG